MENLLVIKIGGNIIDDAEKLADFLQNFAAVKGHKILIHGGGKLATKMAEGLQIPQQMIDGRRITDAETLKIVTMVYAGSINKNIVAQLQSFGCNAIGLSGADGNLIEAHKRTHPTLDFGFVGDVDAINSSLINAFLHQGLTLVIAPITHNNKGQLLNTNADTIAQEIAKAMASHMDTQLIYSFEKEGVLQDVLNEQSVIPTLNPTTYAQLKKEKVIFEGMIPKLDNAFAALQSGVKKVIIGKAEKLEELINGTAGTTLIHE